MIFQDRTGENLNRKKIKIISQTPNEIIADIERADTPTVEGTQINASVFNSFQEDIDTANTNASNAMTNANAALVNSTSAITTSNDAIATANSASNNASIAVNTANDASLNANNALSIANNANYNVSTAIDDSSLALSRATEAFDNATQANTKSSEAKIKVDELETTLNEFTSTEYKLSIYPIGAFYFSDNETSPSELFGGTWIQLYNKFLIGAGDTYPLNSDGGEATHTLTLEEMPSHQHYIYNDGGETSLNSPGMKNAWIGNNGLGVLSSAQGGSQPHNNMPPYLAINMWKRTH